LDVDGFRDIESVYFFGTVFIIWDILKDLLLMFQVPGFEIIVCVTAKTNNPYP